MITKEFDWQNPDYVSVFRRRIEVLKKLTADPKLLASVKQHYKNNPVDFLCDFGCTTDPRNVEIGRPVVIPFILFPRQIEWCQWVLDSWHSRRPGVSPKSRESGVSWLAIALSCTLCLFNDDLTIGFGSRKLELVDKIGKPDSLFWKARKFMTLLPKIFRGPWNPVKDAPTGLIKFPSTNSVIQGEGGDNIGRGGRSAIYFVDEADYLEHPELAEASLSATTNCRIDISTAHGLGTPFHRKVTEWPPERVFRFHWRDDPRKDEAWYEKQKFDLDAVTVAQEIDIDFAAAVEGVLIPSSWVQASIDAHLKLGIEPSGARFGALDVADEGRDLNAFCGAHGLVIEYLEEWAGKNSDIFSTMVRAFSICDSLGYRAFRFDADGLGAGARGDSRIINENRYKDWHERTDRGPSPVIQVEPYRGSAEVVHPEREDVKGRKNRDFFANLKAQAGWHLRRLFQNTYRAVVEDVPYNPDDIISISSKLPLLRKFCMELSQPTYSLNHAGKVMIDKAPEGARSPNLYDAAVIRMAPLKISMNITAETLVGIAQQRRG